jgi:hypothetical protein
MDNGKYVVDGVVQLPGVEWIAFALFLTAGLLNRRLEGNNWSPWAVMPIAILGSLMWFASSWAAKASNGVEGLLTGMGAPASALMSLLCVIALAGTVADLWLDPTYNVAAVWALIIAPVAAHGAGGFIGDFIREGLYGGTTLAAWQMLRDVLGG